MTPKWKNDLVEAWTLDDGTLIVRTKIETPTDGHDFYYKVDTLPPFEGKR